MMIRRKLTFSLCAVATSLLMLFAVVIAGDVAEKFQSNRAILNASNQESGSPGITSSQGSNGYGSSVLNMPGGSGVAGGWSYSGRLVTSIQRSRDDSTSGATVSDTTAIGGHSAILTEDGQLWMWGKNNFGQCGNGSTTTATEGVISPTLVQMPYVGSTFSDGFFNETNRTTVANGTSGGVHYQGYRVQSRWASVALGQRFTIALTEQGALLGWGEARFLGMGYAGSSTTAITKPRMITSTNRFKAIAANWEAAAAIDNLGRLWVWGGGAQYNLGNGSTAHQPNLVQIASGTTFKAVAVNAYAIFAITMGGVLWSAGAGGYNGYNSSNKTTLSSTMSVSAGNNDFKAVVCGDEHALFIKGSTNRVYVTGKNNYGQLGIGSTTDQSAIVVSSFTGAAYSVVGGWKSSAVLGEDWTMRICGWNQPSPSSSTQYTLSTTQYTNNIINTFTNLQLTQGVNAPTGIALGRHYIAVVGISNYSNSSAVRDNQTWVTAVRGYNVNRQLGIYNGNNAGGSNAGSMTTSTWQNTYYKIRRHSTTQYERFQEPFALNNGTHTGGDANGQNKTTKAGSFVGGGDVYWGNSSNVTTIRGYTDGNIAWAGTNGASQPKETTSTGNDAWDRMLPFKTVYNGYTMYRTNWGNRNFFRIDAGANQIVDSISFRNANGENWYDYGTVNSSKGTTITASAPFRRNNTTPTSETQWGENGGFVYMAKIGQIWDASTGATVNQGVIVCEATIFQPLGDRYTYVRLGMRDPEGWCYMGPDVQRPRGQNYLSISFTTKSNQITITGNPGGGTTSTGSSSGWSNVGGTGNVTKTITIGSAVGYLPTVTRTGYAETTSSWTNKRTETPEANVTYTATWTGYSYTVTYNSNAPNGIAATGNTASTTMVYGSSYALAQNGFTRNGYTFGGWKSSASGASAQWSAGATWTSPGGGTMSAPTGTGQSYTVYAHWTANSNYLDFCMNYSSPDPATYNNSPPSGWNWDGSASYKSWYRSIPTDTNLNTYISQLYTPIRPGFTFVGWFNTTASSGGTQYTATNNQVMPPSATQLYARWTVANPGWVRELLPSSIDTGTSLGSSGTDTLIAFRYGTAAAGGTLNHPPTVQYRTSTANSWTTWSQNSTVNGIYWQNFSTSVGSAQFFWVCFYGTPTSAWAGSGTSAGNLYLQLTCTTTEGGSGVDTLPVITVNHGSRIIYYHSNGGRISGGTGTTQWPVTYCYGTTTVKSGTVPAYGTGNGQIDRPGYSQNGWLFSTGGTAVTTTHTSAASGTITANAQWIAQAPTWPTDMRESAGVSGIRAVTWTNGAVNGQSNGTYISGTAVASAYSASGMTSDYLSNFKAYFYNNSGNALTTIPSMTSGGWTAIGPTNSTSTITGTADSGITGFVWTASSTGTSTSVTITFSGTLNITGGAENRYGWLRFQTNHSGNTGADPVYGLIKVTIAPGTRTISYTGDGATSGTAATVTYYYNSKINASGTVPNFARTGYNKQSPAWEVTSATSGNHALASTFDASGTADLESNSGNLTSNITVKQRWVAKTYSISFSSNQTGTNGGPNSALTATGASGTVTATYDAPLPLPSPNTNTAPQRPGYLFTGYAYNGNTYFSRASNNTSLTATSTNWTVDSTATLLAQWQIETFELVLNGNGGVFSPGTVGVVQWTQVNVGSNASVKANVQYGTTLSSILPTPTREGYTHSQSNDSGTAGWQSLPINGKNGAAAISLGQMPAVNDSLTAEWTGVWYYIDFWKTINGAPVDIAGGAYATAPQQYGKPYNLPASPGDDEVGHQFAGWCLSATSFTNIMLAGSNQSQLSTTAMPSNNPLKIYAVYLPYTSTLSFSLNGGELAPGADPFPPFVKNGNLVEPLIARWGEQMPIIPTGSAVAPVRLAYRFMGFELNGTLLYNGLFQSVASWSQSSNVGQQLTARWEASPAETLETNFSANASATQRTQYGAASTNAQNFTTTDVINSISAFIPTGGRIVFGMTATDPTTLAGLSLAVTNTNETPAVYTAKVVGAPENYFSSRVITITMTCYSGLGDTVGTGMSTTKTFNLTVTRGVRTVTIVAGDSSTHSGNTEVTYYYGSAIPSTAFPDMRRTGYNRVGYFNTSATSGGTQFIAPLGNEGGTDPSTTTARVVEANWTIYPRWSATNPNLSAAAGSGTSLISNQNIEFQMTRGAPAQIQLSAVTVSAGNAPGMAEPSFTFTSAINLGTYGLQLNSTSGLISSVTAPNAITPNEDFITFPITVTSVGPGGSSIINVKIRIVQGYRTVTFNWNYIANGQTVAHTQEVRYIWNQSAGASPDAGAGQTALVAPTRNGWSTTNVSDNGVQSYWSTGSTHVQGSSIVFDPATYLVLQDITVYTQWRPTTPTFSLALNDPMQGQESFNTGVYYSYQFTSSVSTSQNLDKTSDVRFVIQAGGLPDGITLAQNGFLSGVPTSAAVYQFTVRAINNIAVNPPSGSSYYQDREFILVLNQGARVVTFNTVPGEGTLNLPTSNSTSHDVQYYWNTAMAIQKNQIPVATRRGYTFIGWYFGQYDGQRFVTEVDVETNNLLTATSIGELELYEGLTVWAHWSATEPVLTNAPEAGYEAIVDSGTDYAATNVGWRNFDAIVSTNNLSEPERVAYSFSSITPLLANGNVAGATESYGLSIDPGTGQITGTPEVVGTYAVTVMITNILAPEAYITRSFLITVNQGYRVITYNMNNGTNNYTNVRYNWKSTTINPSTDYPANAAPTTSRVGYTFDKWTYNQNGTGETFIPGTTVVMNNTVVYAQWIAHKYNLKLDTNVQGGTTTVDWEEQNLGLIMEYDKAWPANIDAIYVPIREGYTFTGYYIYENDVENMIAYYLQNGNRAQGVPNQFNANTYPLGIPANNGTITLYAHWQPNEWHLSIQLNDANPAHLDPATYPNKISVATIEEGWLSVFFDQNWPQVNTSARLALREGYQLTGYWSIDGTDTQYYDGNGNFLMGDMKWTTDGDISLEARWEPKEYELRLNRNFTNLTSHVETDTALAAATVSYEYNKPWPTQVLAPAPRTGYTFRGYFSQPSLGIQYFAPASNVQDATYAYRNNVSLQYWPLWRVSATMNLYAQWDAISYNLVFNDGYGQNPTTRNQAQTFDQRWPVSVAQPDARYGYYFAGWFTAPQTPDDIELGNSVGVMYYTGSGLLAGTMGDYYTDYDGLPSIYNNQVIYRTAGDYFLYAQWLPYRYVISRPVYTITEPDGNGGTLQRETGFEAFIWGASGQKVGMEYQGITGASADTNGFGVTKDVDGEYFTPAGQWYVTQDQDFFVTIVLKDAYTQNTNDQILQNVMVRIIANITAVDPENKSIVDGDVGDKVRVMRLNKPQTVVQFSLLVLTLNSYTVEYETVPQMSYPNQTQGHNGEPFEYTLGYFGEFAPIGMTQLTDGKVWHGNSIRIPFVLDSSHSNTQFGLGNLRVHGGDMNLLPGQYLSSSYISLYEERDQAMRTIFITIMNVTANITAIDVFGLSPNTYRIVLPTSSEFMGRGIEQFSLYRNASYSSIGLSITNGAYYATHGIDLVLGVRLGIGYTQRTNYDIYDGVFQMLGATLGYPLECGRCHACIANGKPNNATKYYFPEPMADLSDIGIDMFGTGCVYTGVGTQDRYFRVIFPTGYMGNGLEGAANNYGGDTIPNPSNQNETLKLGSVQFEFLKNLMPNTYNVDNFLALQMADTVTNIYGDTYTVGTDFNSLYRLGRIYRHVSTEFGRIEHGKSLLVVFEIDASHNKTPFSIGGNMEQVGQNLFKYGNVVISFKVAPGCTVPYLVFDPVNNDRKFGTGVSQRRVITFEIANITGDMLPDGIRIVDLNVNTYGIGARYNLINEQEVIDQGIDANTPVFDPRLQVMHGFQSFDYVLPTTIYDGAPVQYVTHGISFDIRIEINKVNWGEALNNNVKNTIRPINATMGGVTIDTARMEEIDAMPDWTPGDNDPIDQVPPARYNVNQYKLARINNPYYDVIIGFTKLSAGSYKIVIPELVEGYEDFRVNTDLNPPSVKHGNPFEVTVTLDPGYTQVQNEWFMNPDNFSVDGAVLKDVKGDEYIPAGTSYVNGAGFEKVTEEDIPGSTKRIFQFEGAGLNMGAASLRPPEEWYWDCANNQTLDGCPCHCQEVEQETEAPEWCDECWYNHEHDWKGAPAGTINELCPGREVGKEAEYPVGHDNAGQKVYNEVVTEWLVDANGDAIIDPETGEPAFIEHYMKICTVDTPYWERCDTCREHYYTHEIEIRVPEICYYYKHDANGNLIFNSSLTPDEWGNQYEIDDCVCSVGELLGGCALKNSETVITFVLSPIAVNEYKINAPQMWHSGGVLGPLNLEGVLSIQIVDHITQEPITIAKHYSAFDIIIVLDENWKYIVTDTDIKNMFVDISANKGYIRGASKDTNRNKPGTPPDEIDPIDEALTVTSGGRGTTTRVVTVWHPTAAIYMFLTQLPQPVIVH